MRLRIRINGSETRITTSRLETYDGSEIHLMEIGPSISDLGLVVRQGRVWRHRETGDIAIAHVGPWAREVEEELLAEEGESK